MSVKKTVRTYTIQERVVAGLALMVLIAVVVSFEGGGFYYSTHSTVTMAETTLTQTTGVTSFSTDTETTTSLAPAQTSTIYIQVTSTNPSSIQLTGKASVNGIGESATNITFQAADSNASVYSAVITGGTYSLTIPNGYEYNVRIAYTTAVGGLGAGTCTAGAVLLQWSQPEIVASWVC